MNTCAFYMLYYASMQMLAAFTNPTTYDVRRDLVPLSKLPHIFYSHLISSLDNLMMHGHKNIPSANPLFSGIIMSSPYSPH